MKKISHFYILFALFISLNAFSKSTVNTNLVDASVMAASNDACHFNLTSSSKMKVVRIDRHVPCECKPIAVSQFNEREINYFIEGIKSTKGADIKLDLHRGEATLLWKALNTNYTKEQQDIARAQIAKDKKLSDYILQIDIYKDLHGFDFNSEGEVLEALAILDMEERYPVQNFFSTGGISYFNRLGENVIGELDIVVFERASCTVISVGEAKLSRSTSKARQQIARFRKFLKSNGR